LSSNPEFTESLKLGTAVLASVRPAQIATASTPLSATRRRRGVPRTDVAIVFVKQLLRELVSEIPRRFLYAAAGIVTFILLTIIYFNLLGFLEGRRNNRAINELQQNVIASRKEIDKIREDLRIAREKSDIALSSLSLPETVVNNFGGG